ncbi:hypothetical protein SmJEL517_g01281 [Synchytrium microbalum]|uniref:Condensin complex subunit 1 C-terminal domain-containing protein n=1 Tax=Synchytrium microbalum TaxID=1806994 RepID=A0A507CAU4_9FUNG|nr:uncharacterized protein SmJEL517_g01281 [Synchytrium microbalum]TPX36742.1 hypothetical protein SmJEL517_g01281 [Synchytrium microbalum]
MVVAVQTSLPSLEPISIVPEKCWNVSLAFGSRAVPKLIDELNSGAGTDAEKLLTRQRALIALADLFHAPDHTSRAIQIGIVPKLLLLLPSKDITTRQKTVEIFVILAGLAVGRNVLVETEALKPISQLFNDEDLLVRHHAHTVFARATVDSQAVESILNHRLVPLIVAKIVSEKLECQVLGLQTLAQILRLGQKPRIPNHALDCDALGSLTGLLTREQIADIKIGAARCVMNLCFYSEGKALACEGRTVPALIELLGDNKSEVRAAAAGALMSITISVEAKKFVVSEGAVPILSGLLSDKSEYVLLNVIKTITNCAEDYRGRFQLASCIPTLEELRKQYADSPQISDAAKKAIQVISWRP